MRFFVSDEVGQVKDVKLVASSSTSKNNENSKPKTKETQPATITSLTAGINREAQVNEMCWAFKDNSHFVSGCKDGVANVYDAHTGSLKKSLECFKPEIDPLTQEPVRDKYRKQEHFVGLHSHGDRLMSCSNRGKLTYQSLDISDSNPSTNNESTTDITLPQFSTSLKEDALFKMRWHPASPNLFISGGRERDLMLWDAQNTKLPTNNDESASIEPIWKAKNVPHDFLDLRQPIWITDLQFMEPMGDHSKIIVGTGYHQIRLYDIKAGNGSKNKRDANRPCFNVEIGEHPVKSMSVCSDGHSIVFADNIGKLSMFDTRNQKVVCAYKGFSGTVTHVKAFEQNGKSYVSAVGLDQHLRVWNRKTRKLLTQVYLKQKLSTFLVCPDLQESDKEPAKRNSDQSANIWKSMKKVR